MLIMNFYKFYSLQMNSRNISINSDASYLNKICNLDHKDIVSVNFDHIIRISSTSPGEGIDIDLNVLKNLKINGLKLDKIAYSVRYH